MKRFSVVVVFFFLLIPFSAIGSTDFSAIVAFGDSLTDNGSYPYNTNSNPLDLHGYKYFTDGSVWVEMLSDTLDSTLYDVAYGGAMTGRYNLNSTETGLSWQVESAIPAGIGGDDTLFTIWAGANDCFSGLVTYSNAVSNIISAMTTLTTTGGATSILVSNLPDLALTPGYLNDEDAHTWSMAFNNELYAALTTFVSNNRAIDIYFMDINSVFTDLILMPNGEINELYLNLMFWDDVHPSNVGHTIIAGAAYEALSVGPLSAIPVPAAAWLLGSGLVGLVVLRRRF